MQRIFRGRFRLVYLSVKTAGLYLGTFAVCFYWPKFLNYVVDSTPVPELGALALLPPLGFLVLGVCLGKRVFLAHLGLLMLAAPIAYWTSPALSDEAAALVSRWLMVLFGAYILGAMIGGREQFRRYVPDPD